MIDGVDLIGLGARTNVNTVTILLRWILTHCRILSRVNLVLFNVLVPTYICSLASVVKAYSKRT